MTTVLTLAGAWVIMALLMAGLWWRQRATHNAGIVDVAWSFGTALVAIGAIVIASDGVPERRWLVGVMAGLWGARLGVHLVRRVRAEDEDGRYRVLRERWGGDTQRNLFWFFQVQAAWAVLFALPMFAASLSTASMGAGDVIGGVIWLVALSGEGVADAQLARFRRDPANRGRVCRAGLWRYSRHPNYFFEWIHWWAYVAIGVTGPWPWAAVTVAGAIVMLFFLLRVTGVPHTEAQALRSRGDAYRAYQRTTNTFFPGPPRAEESTA